MIVIIATVVKKHILYIHTVCGCSFMWDEILKHYYSSRIFVERNDSVYTQSKWEDVVDFEIYKKMLLLFSFLCEHFKSTVLAQMRIFTRTWFDFIWLLS